MSVCRGMSICARRLCWVSRFLAVMLFLFVLVVAGCTKNPPPESGCWPARVYHDRYVDDKNKEYLVPTLDLETGTPVKHVFWRYVVIDGPGRIIPVDSRGRAFQAADFAEGARVRVRGLLDQGPVRTPDGAAYFEWETIKSAGSAGPPYYLVVRVRGQPKILPPTTATMP